MAALVTSAAAQADWRTSAVPFYSVEQFAQAAARDSLQRAEHWQGAAQQLQSQLGQWCANPSQTRVTTATVQSDWRLAASAWDHLDSIELGPLIKRRSARSVDFMPTRPAMLERAIAQVPHDAESMERVGAPAKGFEALEWLLWPQVPVAGTPRCDYAVAVASHLARESQALVGAFTPMAESEPEQEAALASFSETINQWVGGAEQLRWGFMRKPLEVAGTRGEPAVFPRLRSLQTVDSWAARWSTLRSFAVLGDRATPPRMGSGHLIPLETWLRSRGANALADKLVRDVAAADQAMSAARPGQPATVQAASDALGQLTRLVQSDVAPALDVSMGFSDADGD